MLWSKEQSGSVALLKRNPTRLKNVFWFNLVLLQETEDEKRIYAILDREEHPRSETFPADCLNTIYNCGV